MALFPVLIEILGLTGCKIGSSSKASLSAAKKRSPKKVASLGVSFKGLITLATNASNSPIIQCSILTQH